MPSRRQFLGTAGAILAAPRIVGAQGAAGRTLRFVPQADLTVLDPIYNTATVTLTHGAMVFDTLYALDAGFNVQPQMVEGHVVANDGLQWTLTLREGLRFHDGEPVRGRDCVASIRRWGARDMFGQELLAAIDELTAPDDRTIRFRLKRPFPLLPQALGKVTAPLPAMMPERLALTDPSRAVTEMIGSGPFRFNAAERVSGVRVVYDKFDGYVPRQGAPSRSAGAKIAHMDRVEWHILPDPATAAAALQQNEVDWLEYAPNDLLPILRRARNVQVKVTEDSSISILRFNHLHPPFDNPAIRRALIGALDQAAYMTAAFSEDRSLWRTGVGVFLPNTPMANDAGIAALEGPRDYEKVRQDLIAAGYKGEKVVVLQPMDLAFLKVMADVAVDMFRRVGVNAEAFSADWGTIVQRRGSREPSDRGGWNVFLSGFSAAGLLDPVANLGLRANGPRAWFGWPSSPDLERLRQEWMAAPDRPAQQAKAREIQTQFWQDTPYLPLGEYFRIIAHQRNLVDIPVGMSNFTGVRRI
ncbi:MULTISPECIES: ABC transporter substrate-binding protein [Roseomonadaceae]|uniref:ABC transporter substrate-binding protein n=1 Tax=Falsiroseomonas oleicola TaxID=2801474 RepID=A0ABS6HC69_9PROT|nr:ABC transporter substrate-binding protein [Roseomonas oleicola]MBU8545946.1 ABC transporter substrate-binding protein [Roseomonas oleicola]